MRADGMRALFCVNVRLSVHTRGLWFWSRTSDAEGKLQKYPSSDYSGPIAERIPQLKSVLTSSWTDHYRSEI